MNEQKTAPTPRTDSEHADKGISLDMGGDVHEQMIPANFARQLERENAALRGALTELEKWAHQWTSSDNGLLVKARAALSRARGE